MRDDFYINANRERKEIINYGLEFKDFYQYTPKKISNMLLLKSSFSGGCFNFSTRLTTVNEMEMEDLLTEDIYGYGDFCWIDFENAKSVDNMDPQSLAELLYLGHMSVPLKEPFFEDIRNRYAYFAHDDGWFCRVFCKRYEDFSDIIGSAITSKVEKLTVMTFQMSDEFKNQLLNLAEGGLLIDFKNLIREVETIEIPGYVIGKLEDMDDMLNNRDKYIRNAVCSIKLIHSDMGWKFMYL